MAKYKVEIREILFKEVEVEATNAFDAMNLVQAKLDSLEGGGSATGAQRVKK